MYDIIFSKYCLSLFDKVTDFIVCDVLFSLDVWVLEEPLASDADVFSVSEVLCELFEAKILSGKRVFAYLIWYTNKDSKPKSAQIMRQ